MKRKIIKSFLKLDEVKRIETFEKVATFFNTKLSKEIKSLKRCQRKIDKKLNRMCNFNYEPFKFKK